VCKRAEKADWGAQIAIARQNVATPTVKKNVKANPKAMATP
jgi:hypothetical protein